MLIDTEKILATKKIGHTNNCVYVYILLNDFFFKFCNSFQGRILPIIIFFFIQHCVGIVMNQTIFYSSSLSIHSLSIEFVIPYQLCGPVCYKKAIFQSAVQKKEQNGFYINISLQISIETQQVILQEQIYSTAFCS